MPASLWAQLEVLVQVWPHHGCCGRPASSWVRPARALLCTLSCMRGSISACMAWCTAACAQGGGAARAAWAHPLCKRSWHNATAVDGQRSMSARGRVAWATTVQVAPTRNRCTYLHVCYRTMQAPSANQHVPSVRCCLQADPKYAAGLRIRNPEMRLKYFVGLCGGKRFDEASGSLQVGLGWGCG